MSGGDITGDPWLDGSEAAQTTEAQAEPATEAHAAVEEAEAEPAAQDQPTPPAELPADVTVEAAGESEPTKASESTESDRFVALKEWEKKVKDAKKDVDHARAEYDNLKGQTKEAKKEWEECVAVLVRAIESEPRPLPLFDKKPTAPAAASSPATGHPGDLDVGSDAPVPTPATPDDDAPAPAAVEYEAWKLVDIKEVGFHPGVEKAFRAGSIHTIGEFEDRRAAVYAKTGKWPKGIGKGKAEAAVELVLSWLSKHRDGIDNTGRKERLADELSERADVETETTESDSDNGNGEATYTWNEHTPEEKAAFIHRRANELNNGQEECLAPPPEDEGTAAHYDQGSNAYDAGEPITSCCYAPGKYQDAWLKGWMGARLVDEHEGAVPIVDGEELGVEAGDLEFEDNGLGDFEYPSLESDVDLLGTSAADVEGEMQPE